ncbi:MAG TPA: 5-deoxy-glucuronate isomerase [Anaerovoracaceae bacterium]|nr:5-deoxy-glucuronate isomerase [Anaerovoracaceae bacterium]
MVTVYGEMKQGYNEICNMENNHPDMLMDIGVQVMSAGETVNILEEEKETAVLLLNGEIIFRWEGQSATAVRRSLFDENPMTLHVAKGVEITVTAKDSAEILIQKTTNEHSFPSKIYTQEDVSTEIFGDGLWENTARRACRTVFDYSNAPYSNMVLGELINYPGRWSSYIPHSHDQPEVYFYHFDRKEGFGVAFLGDEPFQIKNSSAFFIPGGKTHPQAAAPGFAMHYCWAIRHLKDNPWTTRVNDERYTWLLEKHVKIWPNK